MTDSGCRSLRDRSRRFWGTAREWSHWRASRPPCRNRRWRKKRRRSTLDWAAVASLRRRCAKTWSSYRHRSHCNSPSCTAGTRKSELRGASTEKYIIHIITSKQAAVILRYIICIYGPATSLDTRQYSITAYVNEILLPSIRCVLLLRSFGCRSVKMYRKVVLPPTPQRQRLLYSRRGEGVCLARRPRYDTAKINKRIFRSSKND